MPIRWLGIAIDVKPGGFRVVTSVAQMGEILANRWPEDKRGDEWRVAVEACLRSLGEQTNSEAAREAFIMAAKASGIAVDGNHERFDPPKRR